MAITSHNTPALSKQTRSRGVLTPAVWNELHDFLTLALDALGNGPEDFDAAFLHNAVLHQRLALRITHGALQRLGSAA